MSSPIPPARKEKLANLEGLVDPPVGQRLAGLAATVPADQVIVELGSFKGKSGCYLAEGATRGIGAHVYCVDPWDTRGNVTGRFGFAEQATRETFLAQVAEMGFMDAITPVQAFSTAAARTWDRPIGLLFIDGSHLYDDVRNDFKAWHRYIAPGAWLVFDDYTGRNRGVKRAADWVKAHFPGYQEWEYEPIPLAIAHQVA